MSKITPAVLKTLKKLSDKYDEFPYTPETEEEKNAKEIAGKEYDAYKEEYYYKATEITDSAIAQLMNDGQDPIFPCVNKISNVGLSLICSADLYTFCMNGLTELTEKQVDIMTGLLATSRKWRSRNVHLDGLKKVPDSFFEKFANVMKKGQTLSLNGLEEVSDTTQSLMGRVKFDRLKLNSLKAINPKPLGRYRGGLYIGGLKEFTVETAQQMSKWKCAHLTIGGFDTLSKEVVAEIAKTEIDSLDIGRGWDHDVNHTWALQHSPGPKSIPKDVMEVIATKMFWRLKINSATELDVDTATVISNMRGEIDFPQIESKNLHPDILPMLSVKKENFKTVYFKDIYINRNEGKVESRL
jgi:hypothetical protein